jgi:hypothetical protein
MRVDSLATELVAAERLHAHLRTRLEELLDSLYPDGWEDVEVGETEIDVYGVVPSSAAVEALRLAGWATVHQHDHGADSFRHCCCRAKG